MDKPITSSASTLEPAPPVATRPGQARGLDQFSQSLLSAMLSFKQAIFQFGCPRR